MHITLFSADSSSQASKSSSPTRFIGSTGAQSPATAAPLAPRQEAAEASAQREEVNRLQDQLNVLRHRREMARTAYLACMSTTHLTALSLTESDDRRCDERLRNAMRCA